MQINYTNLDGKNNIVKNETIYYSLVLFRFYMYGYLQNPADLLYYNFVYTNRNYYFLALMQLYTNM